MRSRAAILYEYGQPWSVEEFELDPPRAGEVLVQLAASGLCHSDEHIRMGFLYRRMRPADWWRRRSGATKDPAWWSKSATVWVTSRPAITS